ncbi:MAG TPA: 2-dehydropantoate 2-reductase N-terminal domain-containing protein [Candidatus Limnocylindrales bacterium]
MTGPEPALRDQGAGAVVIGGGAVGTFLAALIAGSGRRVTLAGRPGAGTRGPAGIVVRAPDGGLRQARAERTDGTAGLDRPAYVVLAVKMPDLAEAVEACAAWPGLAVVTLQNGIGAEELVANARPDAPLLAGSLTAPIDREANGTLAWRKRRGIAFSSVRGDTTAVRAAIGDSLAAGGLPVATVGDWRAMKWSKLLTNLVANAIPALLDVDAAAVYADRRLFAVERAQVGEALAVMRALHLAPVGLPGADVRWLALGFRAPAALGHPILQRVVGGARGGKAPSLLLHLRGGGGPSESPWLNGGVARAGAVAGVPTPVNAALASLVEAASADPLAWDRTRGRPGALLDMLDHPATTRRDP